ncbi:hypothetical protein DV736_g6028, partial [Chaetothyriales sp. CBS 134916]
MFAKKLVIKGISSGIGFVAEGIAEHKERKEQRFSRSPSPNPLATSRSRDGGEKRTADNDSDSASEDDDEFEWQLDEATAELSPPQYDDIKSDRVIDADDVANDFLAQYQFNIQPSQQSSQYRPLPASVILPQRRPKSKQRGFIRAYAPVLGECSGIDQKMFMDFLKDFDKASEASPVYDVINVACFAVGFVPNPIAMGVSIAVQVANNTAKELHSRYTRNAYLDKINDTVFKPRGLYCMIMTFKPNAPPLLGVDVTSTDQALAKNLTTPDTALKKKLRTIRLTSGKTQGELGLPEVAPLVYPAINEYAAKLERDGKEPSTLSTASAFVGSYLDKKAQSRYSAANPDSKLAVPESERTFKSKYADPNHPIHSGTLDVRMGRRVDRTRTRPAGPVGIVFKTVRKVIQSDVLYLTIVNLPSEAEMTELNQRFEQEVDRVG